MLILSVVIKDSDILFLGDLAEFPVCCEEHGRDVALDAMEKGIISWWGILDPAGDGVVDSMDRYLEEQNDGT